MFNITSADSTLFKTHRLRLERNATEVVRIEVRETLQNGKSANPPKFTAHVIDAMGLPSKKFMSIGNTLKEAVNQLLPQAQSLPIDVLCPPIK
ncbi:MULTISPECIES: hypothetical protein [unclassified Microbulbifer]|uniref:Uncharacterized protein n=1 Tax=Microbulbifer spongiae TaxID=2944933 RepID=A0ABY9EHP4_9GAMM|nr:MULTISPECIES: hypothetical protein [unclassified Microbulbifer]MDP5210017.1 hypothetical protein [Microbulbifer sp. 2205BS26-8]WKD51708.1 hypothetical protein M8T91_18525 [Microbulbifer sp. MI-G]